MILTMASLPMMVMMLRCERKGKEMMVRITSRKGMTRKTERKVRKMEEEDRSGQNSGSCLQPRDFCEAGRRRHFPIAHW